MSLVVDDTMDLARAIETAKPLFAPDLPEEALEGEAKAPTLANLKAALSGGENKDKVAKHHLHQHSNIRFEIQTMSSQGYLALNHVEKYNPMTGHKQSTPEQDEVERNIIYLMHGVKEPKLDRPTALEILKTPNWGPSNTALITAIQELNPGQEERVNNIIVLMAFCRFEALILRIFREAGALKELAQHLSLNDDVVESLNYCVDLFSALFRVEDSAKQWGIPLDYAALCNAKQILKDRGLPEEELAGLPDPPEQQEVQPQVNIG